MVKYKSAKLGYKFVLTEKGFEVPRVRGKFEKNSPHRSIYEKKLPASWYDNGWVTETKMEDDNGKK